MAIIQISKIQQRSGNLVDLPQLDEAQFGFAQDASRLFIGKTTGTPENIEVLTSYSEISFSQVQGSGNSNVNITSNTLHFGQILGYDSVTNSWVNTGGNANSPGNTSEYTGIPVHLGSVSNVKIGGGAIGYVLTTDGSGTLSWSPKTTVIANILAISNASPAIMTFNPNIVSYVSGTAITILGVEGNANSEINGETLYVKVANNFGTTGNISLYTDDTLANAFNGANLTYTNSPNATATSSFGVGGSSPAAGVDGSIQYNVSGVLTGSSLLKYANGNVEIANSSVIISNGNVSANLLTGTLTTNAQPNITSTGTLAGLVVAGNITPNTDITYNLGNNTNRFNDLYLANSTIYIGSQTISANATNVIISGILTANISGNITGNAATAGTVTTNAQPNITSVGILTSLSVSGNITTGNLDGANSITANYFIGSGNNLSNIQGANVSGAVSFATTANSVALANVSGAGNIASINLDGSTSNVLYGNGVFAPVAVATYGNSDVATFLGSYGSNTITTTGNVSVGNIIGNGQALTGIAGANVTGAVTYAGTANSVALSNVSGAGNIASINLDGSTSNVLYGNGVFAPAAVSYGNSNVATFLASFGTNTITTTGTITSGNANLGNLVVANFFSGDGGLLSNINIAAGSSIVNGNSNVTVAANSNVSISVAGTPNVVVVTNTLANITGNLSVSSNITAGNISATLFTGNGQALTGLPGANVTGTVANATYAITSGSATTAGTVTTAAQPNITSTGTLASLSVTGNVTAGNFIGTGAGTPTLSSATNLDLSATVSVRVVGGGTLRLPNLTSAAIANLIAANGDVAYNTTSNKFQAYEAGAWSNVSDLPTTVLSTGANTTAGTITGNWTLTAGSKLEATYADLAEYYEADQHYEPGTVLAFGGDKEVTIAEDNTARVAGVVSTNPAYAMNANCQGIAVAIALQGRVPTKVRGAIRKGDMMVSGGNGFAKPSTSPQMGTVIGKALENFDGIEGIIEIAVGRL
jgi:hypothetical protein